MKKLLSLLLALTMVFALAACNTGDDNTGNDEGTTEPTEPEIVLPESALKLLESAWAAHNEEEKGYFAGGDFNAMVMGAPGTATDADFINYTLLLPAEQNDNVTEVASLMHAMNGNNLTCVAYKLAEGVDVSAFATAACDAVKNNQWMCGFPDEVVVYTLGDAYVVVMFGLTDITGAIQDELTTAHPDLVLAYEGAIA